MVCVNVRSHIRAPACTRLHPLTPTCTRSHISHVRVCGRANFRTSALSHTYPKFFLQNKTPAATPCTLHTFCTRAGVRTCEISHIRTFTHISKNFFAKKNSGSHTMHIAHILQACGCADVRNFAHPHFHTHFQKFFCKLRLGAQSVTLLSTLRDPTQLRQHQCATIQQHPISHVFLGS